MTELTDLTDRLHRAADGPSPGFGTADVRRRVDRRRRRGRGAAAALLVLVFLGTALAVSGTGDRDEGTDRAAAGSIGTDELTATPWIMMFLEGDPVVGGKPAWVSFGSDGSLEGHDGCGPFVATWRWDGQALDIDGLDDRPPGCDRLEGSSLVGTPTPLLDVLASDPVPVPPEVVAGGLRLRSGATDAATPWIELTPFHDLDPVTDGTVITGRWSTADRGDLHIEAETIAGGAACEAPAPWSLSAEGLALPACIADLVDVSDTTSLEVRSFGPTLWLRDGDRLVWLLHRDLTSPPAGFDDLVGSRWIVRRMPDIQAFNFTPWLELQADGTVQGSTGFCGTFEGRWSIEDGVLHGLDLRGPERDACAPPPSDLQVDLGDGLRLARPEGAGNELQLDPAYGQGSDGRSWVLRRFDQIGEPATAEDLVGAWGGQRNGWKVTFSTDGTVEISASECRAVRPWSVADGIVIIGEAADNAVIIGEAADDACHNGIAQLPLPDEIDARVEGSTLRLSGKDGVVTAYRIAA